MADPFPEFFSSDFELYLMENRYSFHRLEEPSEHYPRWGPCVFFSDRRYEPIERWIQVKIKSLFSNFNAVHHLCQFWRVVERGSRCFLTTRNQPFYIRCADEEGVCVYRRVCESFELDVFDEGLLGIPKRAFRNRSIESTPNVENNILSEDLLRNYAVVLGIESSFAFPVFERVTSICVGVIEVAGDLDDYPSIYEKLMEVGLEGPDP